jgi:hypothetical protein
VETIEVRHVFAGVFAEGERFGIAQHLDGFAGAVCGQLKVFS